MLDQLHEPRSSLALIAQEFQGRERGTALGIWGGVTAAAVAIGPLVGGALVDALSWRCGRRRTGGGSGAGAGGGAHADPRLLLTRTWNRSGAPGVPLVT